MYDVQEDGLCTICRRELARRKRGTTCHMCGAITKPKHLLCDTCAAYARLQACSKPCKHCGTVFVPPSLALKNTPYCSSECAAAEATARSEARKAKLGTKEQLTEKFISALKEHPDASNKEICEEILHISRNVLRVRGINLQEIRDDLGIHVAKKKIAVSKFELKIKALLEQIFGEDDVVWQKTFPDLKDKNYLRVDFYIKSLNLLIEADGHQHNTPYRTDIYLDPTPHDNMKNEYAKSHKINLLRIFYFNNTKRYNDLKKLLETIRCRLTETPDKYLFNCWNGGDKLLPISSQGMTESYKVQRPSRKGVGTSVPKQETPNV